jgi:hypothetical protein
LIKPLANAFAEISLAEILLAEVLFAKPPYNSKSSSPREANRHKPVQTYGDQ